MLTTFHQRGRRDSNSLTSGVTGRRSNQLNYDPEQLDGRNRA